MKTFLTNFEAADPKLDRLGGLHTAVPVENGGPGELSDDGIGRAVGSA